MKKWPPIWVITIIFFYGLRDFVTGCLLPLATKRDYLKRRLLLVTPWRPLSQVYFDTDEFKPPTSQLSSRDKKGGEKVAKKARRVLDMTELRQRPIAARLHDRPCDPSTPISASCAAMSDPWQPKILVVERICRILFTECRRRNPNQIYCSVNTKI